MEKLLESKVLKDLGMDEASQWMLYDDNLKEFFEHLANLDEDNILTDEELKQYKELKAAGLYVEGEELEEKLKEVELRFPGILTITGEEVEEMERELAFLEADCNEREERIERMKKADEKQLKEISEIEEKYQELDYQENLLTEELEQKAAKLSNLQKSNQQMVRELNEIYAEPQNPPALIFQMPLEEHFQKCEEILGKLELFMRQHFNVTANVDEPEELQLPAEVLEIKKRILETEQKKFDLELTTAGFADCLKNVDKFKSGFSTDEVENRARIEEIEAENEILSAQLEVLCKEAKALVAQSCEQEMMKIFCEHFKEKNKRELHRLDAIQTVENLVSDVTLNCELLWVALQLDLERLQNRVDNTEELATKAQNCEKRIRQMKIAAKRDPDAALNEFILKKLQDLVIEKLGLKREQLPTVVECLEELVRHHDNIASMVKASVNEENPSELAEVMHEIDRQSNHLREFIFTGPTNRPHLYDTKFLMQIFEREQKKNEVEKVYEQLKSDYKKNIIEPWDSDRFFKMERNLWIYFLTEPKKVLECISEVKKKAAQKGSTSFKALNINLSKAV